MSADVGELQPGQDLESDLGFSDDLVTDRCCCKRVHPECVYFLASPWAECCCDRIWSVALDS